MPPLPKRRTRRQQPSRCLTTFISQFIQTSRIGHYSSTAAPASTTTTFLNPESSDNAYTLGRPHMTSSFHSSSRILFDSTLSIPYKSSPDRSPSRKSLDFPNVQPEIDPHQPNPFESLITSSFTTQDHHYQNSHSPSQSYLYSDPFSGSFKQLQGHPTNVNESFEKIHGPSNINNLLPPSAPHYH